MALNEFWTDRTTTDSLLTTFYCSKRRACSGSIKVSRMSQAPDPQGACRATNHKRCVLPTRWTVIRSIVAPSRKPAARPVSMPPACPLYARTCEQRCVRSGLWVGNTFLQVRDTAFPHQIQCPGPGHLYHKMSTHHSHSGLNARYSGGFSEGDSAAEKYVCATRMHHYQLKCLITTVYVRQIHVNTYRCFSVCFTVHGGMGHPRCHTLHCQPRTQMRCLDR